MLVPLYPGINCAMGMLQTAVRHSYLRSEVGVLSRFPVARMRELFAALEAEALAEAQEEGFAAASVKLTRLLDLRYPHQGYTLAVECAGALGDDADKAALKRDFDALHRQVYGQSAPHEDAEIVTFRAPGRDRRAAARTGAPARAAPAPGRRRRRARASARCSMSTPAGSYDCRRL